MLENKMEKMRKLLEFKKLSRILGIECGYYFKGKLLSRYKTESIKILRERIEKAGSEIGDKSISSWEKGMKALPDEAQVIMEEYEKSKRKTDKTYDKKKPYYKELHKRAIKHSILTLNERIRMKELRKIEVIKDFDKSIQEIKDKINILEKE
jgi:hypothetical protein